MSTESPLNRNIIQTATVGIFSPDMKRMVVIVNRRFWRILPPGGKFEMKKGDKNIIDTMLREIEEEIGLILSSKIGVFLNSSGQVIEKPTVVVEESFDFIDGSGAGRDSLFLFRLHADILPEFLKGETQWYLLTKEELNGEDINVDGHKRKLFLPPEQNSQMKAFLLDLMK